MSNNCITWFACVIVSYHISMSTCKCTPPVFPGDQSLPMSPTQLLVRSGRIAGVPSDAAVWASANVQRIQRVMPETAFKYLFPLANQGMGPGKGPYSYFNFLKAAAKWPAFCNEAFSPSADLDHVCKTELATMFAHFAQEVGAHDPNSPYPTWRQALYHFTEMGCSATGAGCEYTGGTCAGNTWQGVAWPCPTGVKYFGRGAKQLSYNFNYGPFSNAVFKDVNVLLRNPELVVANNSQDGWLSSASAVWFYMTPQSPKPSMHDVVAGFWTPNAADLAANRQAGFGVTIQIINGGVECGGTVEVAQAANRILYFQGFTQYFGLSPGDPSTWGCARQMAFESSSSASAPAYWDRSWASPNACQLVAYQTGWSIYDDPTDLAGPYSACVTANFGSGTCDASATTAGPGQQSTTAGVAQPCTNCDSCVAVPDNYQAATDAACAHCARAQQSWWPCNLAGLCQCANVDSTTTASPTATTTKTATTAATTTKTTTLATSTSTKTATPTTTTKTTTPTTKTTTLAPTTTPVPSSTGSPSAPCGRLCSSCVAVKGNSATPDQCAACAWGLGAWWPCPSAGITPTGPSLCVCAALSLESARPQPCGPTCSTTCRARPNNQQGITDARCEPCGAGQGPFQTFNPCNLNLACQCAA